MAVIPSPGPGPDNEDACRRAAAQLQHDYPHWLVIWGCYTRSYVAFPLFAAPRGTILSATTPDGLATRMRRQERLAAAAMPPPAPAPGWQEAQDSSPGGPPLHRAG